MNLGGFYPSQGEQSFGDLRARYWVEYSNATSNKIQEVYMNNPDEFDNPREILAAMVAGDLDSELAKDNEVDPETFDRDEWVDAYEADNDGAGGGESAEDEAAEAVEADD